MKIRNAVAWKMLLKERIIKKNKKCCNRENYIWYGTKEERNILKKMYDLKKRKKEEKGREKVKRKKREENKDK